VAWPSDRSRRFFGASVVLVGLLVTALGGYAVASALEEPAGAPVGFDGLRVRPLSGWAAAGSGEVEGWTFFRLTRGTGNLDVAVRVGTPSGGEDIAAIRYVDEVLRRSLARLTVSEDLERVAMASGLRGVRFNYTGVVVDTRQAIEGEVTVAVTAGGAAIAFDAWTHTGLLPFVLSDAHAMIDGAQVA
jgi:hypothetical protein